MPNRYVSFLDSNHRSNLFTFEFKAMKIARQEREEIKRFDLLSCALLGNSSWSVPIAWENRKEERNLNLEWNYFFILIPILSQ